MTETPQNPTSCRRECATFVTLFLLTCAFLALLRFTRGQLLNSGDDYGRFGYAMAWAQQPFLAPGDHLWLSGNFALLGGLVRLAQDPMEALLLFALLSWVALGSGLFYFARVFALPTWGALLGTLLFLLNPMVPPLLLTPMPDMFFWALLIGAATAAAHAHLSPAVGFRANAAAILCVALAGTFRYEAWLVAVPIACSVNVWVYRHRGGEKTGTGWLAALSLLPFLFPAIWMWSSWKVLGAPLRFTENAHNPLWRHYGWAGPFRLDPASPVTFGGRVRDAIFMLQWLWTMGWVPLTLSLLALPFARPSRGRFALLLPAAWMTTVCVIAMVSGISGNSPERLTAIAVCTLTILSAGWWCEILFRRLARRPYLISLTGFALLALFVLGKRSAAEHAIDRPHRSLSTSAITMGWRMRYEFGPSSEYLAGISHREKVHMWASVTRAESGETHAISALSGDPDRFDFRWEPLPPIERWRERDVRLLLVADVPEAILLDQGYTELLREGDYALWARPQFLGAKRDEGASLGGTPAEPTLRQPHFGLEWAIAAPERLMPWGESNHVAENLVYAGHDDWRLPTIEELWKISAYTTDNEPGYDARLTPRHRTYWSATAGPAEGTRRAVDFTRLFPLALPETSSAGVRPVRTAE